MSATILVVDDSDNLRAAMRQALEAAELDATVLEAADGAEGLTRALAGGVDVVVSDVVMPNLDGIGMLRAIRAQHDELSLPVILVTSQAEPGVRDSGFEAGANDYLVRPFSPPELVLRVRVQLRLRALQGELNQAKERFRNQSGRDPLTGAGNRRGFLDGLGRELSRCRRHGGRLTIAMLDVCQLRRLNQRLGARATDALIAEVAEVVGRQLRSHDRLARYEGGHFALLLPESDRPQGRIVLERIVEILGGRVFAGLGVGELAIAAGLVVYPGGGLESVEALSNAAQACLDRAKALGAGTIIEWPLAPADAVAGDQLTRAAR